MRIKRQQYSKALVVIVGTNINNNDIMSSKWDNYSPISCTAIPHISLALQENRPFSKSKNAFITKHPTAIWHPSVIRHLQVLPFCHIPIVMSLKLLWVSERSFELCVMQVLSSLQCQKPSVRNQGFELEKYKSASIISRTYMPHYIRHPHLLRSCSISEALL